MNSVKKITKRSIQSILLVFALAMCFSMVAFARREIQFSDPTTSVGENVSVRVKVLSDEVTIESAQVSLSYDAESLRFLSGEGASGGNGSIELSAAGAENQNEIEFNLEFMALKEGRTEISIAASTVTATGGQVIQVSYGQSHVDIGPGELPEDFEEGEDGGDGYEGTVSGATGMSVTVGAGTYTVEAFGAADIPSVFRTTELALNGQNVPAVIHEMSDQHLVFLKDANGETKWFAYNMEKGEFFEYHRIDVSTEHFIILLKDADNLTIPEGYEKADLTLSGGTEIFPAWQNVQSEEGTDFYLVYALSDMGAKELYKYDTQQKTYQRFVETQRTSSASETTEAAEGLLGKGIAFMKRHMVATIIVVWGVFLTIFVILIILAVKLRHRNMELDDLYEEYGLYEDEDEEERKPKKGRKKVEEFDDDDFEDDDLDFEEIDFEDEVKSKRTAKVRDLDERKKRIADTAEVSAVYDDFEKKPKRARKDSVKEDNFGDDFEIEYFDMGDD